LLDDFEIIKIVESQKVLAQLKRDLISDSTQEDNVLNDGESRSYADTVAPKILLDDKSQQCDDIPIILSISKDKVGKKSSAVDENENQTEIKRLIEENNKLREKVQQRMEFQQVRQNMILVLRECSSLTLILIYRSSRSKLLKL
jgi:hypothetical protein